MSEFALRFLVANLAIGAAVLVVLALRAPVRALFGARLTYAMWLLVPLAGLASLLPPRVEQIVNFVRPAPEMRAEFQGPAPWEPMLEMPGQDGPTPADAPRIAAPASEPAMSQPMVRETSGFEMPSPIVLGLMAWLIGVIGMAVWQLRRQSRFVSDAKAGFAGPAVVGVIHPRIVTPSDFETTFDASEREMILTHERIHIEGNDARINALAALAGCICWFNPLVHLGAYFMRIDQELACDASVVIRHPEAKSLYASALLKAQLARAPLPLGCHWPSRSEHPLLQRVEMLGRAEPARGRRIAGVVLLGLLAAASGVTAWAALPPEKRVIEREITEAPGMGDVAAPQDAPAPQDAHVQEPLRIVALRRALLEIRSPSGTMMVRRFYEAGETYLPRTGVGWTVSAEDGSAFEWRAGDKSLGLLAPSGAVNLAPVDKALAGPQPIKLQVAPQEGKDAPAPEQQPQKLPAGFDANDPVYLRGTVEKIDFADSTYTAYIRARNVAAGPAAPAKADDHLWKLSPINYWGDRDRVSKDILREPVDVTGYRSSDKTCGPTCQMHVSTMIKCSVQATFAPGCAPTLDQQAPYQQQTPPAGMAKPIDGPAFFGSDRADPIVIRGKVERIDFSDTKYTLFVRASSASWPGGFANQADNSLFELSPTSYWGDRAAVNSDLRGKEVVIQGNRTSASCDPACKVTVVSLQVALPTALPPITQTPGFSSTDVVMRYDASAPDHDPGRGAAHRVRRTRIRRLCAAAHHIRRAGFALSGALRIPLPARGYREAAEGQDRLHRRMVREGVHGHNMRLAVRALCDRHPSGQWRHHIPGRRAAGDAGGRRSVTTSLMLQR